MVLGTKMSTQYRLLALVFKMRKKVVDLKVECKRRIRWGKLKGEATSTFLNRIEVLGYLRQCEDENHMWKAMADTIRQAAKGG